MVELATQEVHSHNFHILIIHINLKTDYIQKQLPNEKMYIGQLLKHGRKVIILNNNNKHCNCLLNGPPTANTFSY